MQSTRSIEEETNITQQMAVNVAKKYKTLLYYSTFQLPAYLTWLDEKASTEDKQLLGKFANTMANVLFDGDLPDVTSLDTKFRVFAKKKKACALTCSPDDTAELTALADDINELEYRLKILNNWKIAIAEMNDPDQTGNTSRLKALLNDCPYLANTLIDNISKLQIVQKSFLAYLNRDHIPPYTPIATSYQPPTPSFTSEPVTLSGTPMTLFSHENPGQRLYETGLSYLDNGDYETASTLFIKAGQSHHHAPSLMKLAQIVKDNLGSKTDKLEASWHYFRAHLHAADVDTQQQAFDSLLNSYKTLLAAEGNKEANASNPFYDSVVDLIQEAQNNNTISIMQKICRLTKAYSYLYRLEIEHAQANHLPITASSAANSFLSDAKTCYRLAHNQFLSLGAHKDDLRLLENLTNMMENLERLESPMNKLAL